MSVCRFVASGFFFRLLVNFDCSTMWVRDSSLVVDTFNIDKMYLRHNFEVLESVEVEPDVTALMEANSYSRLPKP